jgi:RNA polymerase sigma-B factor
VADTEAWFGELAATGDRRVRNRIFDAHREVAEHYANRYSGRGVAREDLRQIALLALLRAITRFDPGRGVTFRTFASRSVEGEVKRYFRDRTWTIRPPRPMQELHLDVRRAEDELTQSLGRAPTVPELAERCDATTDQVLEALEAGGAHRAESLDHPADAETGPVAADDDVDGRLLVGELLAGLPERERAIVEMRFFEELSQPEIAARVGVSQSYLSRVLRQTLGDLRARLRD